MAVTMHDLVLSDGRHADVLVGGAPAGPALILHHGTPSDATVWLDWDQLARAHDLQLIAVSRPGYAISTRFPGRSVADVAVDVEHVIAHFDVPWFVTAGWSGGGPHALACAALLPQRCRAAATLAGVGPSDATDLAFLAGMGPENVAEFTAAMSGEVALRAWLDENGAPFRTISGDQMVRAYGGLVSQPDRDALVGGFADRLADETRRALAHGIDGWIDDDLAFARPWNFDIAAVRVPVTVWQGDLDLMVPAQHGRWLATHLPTATLRLARGHGHISLVAGDQAPIIRDLLAHAVGAGSGLTASA